MDTFLAELPTLIITLVVLGIVGVLLFTKNIDANSPLVLWVGSIILPFWFLQSAFKWQSPPPAKSTDTTPPAKETP